MNGFFLFLCVAVGVAAYCGGRHDGHKDGVADGIAARDEAYERRIADLQKTSSERVMMPMSGRVQWHTDVPPAFTPFDDKFLSTARAAGITVEGRS